MLDGSWNLSLIALALLLMRKKSSRSVYAVSVVLWVITACLLVYLLFIQ